MNKDFKQRIMAKLPTRPGIYLMLDVKGHVLYVGKARNLRDRVSTYLQRSLSNSKTAAMMLQVVDIEVTITANENEALLLEANCVKQLRPRYNILLRDDKSYPYLFLAIGQDFPRLDFYRGNKSEPGRYFGPYPSAKAVRDNLALIQKLFLLRQCSDNFFRHRTRPCLQYQIKRCTAPCVGYVNKEDYHQQVQLALLFLEGKNEQIIDDLSKKMEETAARFEYEQAAHYRDQIATLRKIREQQCITQDQGDIDIIGAAASDGIVAIMVLFVRAGRLIGSKAYFPKIPEATDVHQVLEAFVPQYYLSPMRGEIIVQRIILTERLPNKEWIQNALRAELGKKIQISDKKHVRFYKWQAMAQTNAEHALNQYLTEHNTLTGKYEALQAVLQLPNPILTMECFDISHTQGEATVAARVVFGPDGPDKQAYRRFNIKDITLGDDYAAIRQALTRHYTRLKAQDDELPDLLIIDGGKGQLTQAISVLEELQVSGVTLLAVSKGPSRKAGLEQLWLVGKPQSLQLTADHPALHLIQWIRDEAHRFAITGHRQKRAKTRKQSPLEGIEGIGPKRRRDLLRHFGGLQGLRQASLDDLMKIAGISEVLAKRIYDNLH